MEPDPEPDPLQPVLNCFDPWKREVLAFYGQQKEHIEDRRPELVGQYAAVKETIRTPDVVTSDATYPDRENFYRRGAVAGYGRLYLKVCVGYGPGNFFGTFLRGTVITAYLTPKVGKGEAQKWP